MSQILNLSGERASSELQQKHHDAHHASDQPHVYQRYVAHPKENVLHAGIYHKETACRWWRYGDQGSSRARIELVPDVSLSGV